VVVGVATVIGAAAVPGGGVVVPIAVWVVEASLAEGPEGIPAWVEDASLVVGVLLSEPAEDLVALQGTWIRSQRTAVDLSK
jgi:hypothetical protein